MDYRRILVPLFAIAFILFSSVSAHAGTTTYTYDDVNHVIHIQRGGGTPAISATAGANGSISPSGSVTVNSGSSQSFSITPNPGYEVASVTVDGTSVGAVNSYTFSDVTSNHFIEASFSVSAPWENADLTASPQYTNGAVTYVPGSFTITESFTSLLNVGACQYTINGGTSWLSGAVSGSGPYTCTASSVSAANGTAMKIMMKASNSVGWSTPVASLARVVDSAGPVDGTISAVTAINYTPVNLSWSPANDAGSGLASANTYKLVRATGATAPADCTGTALYQGSALSYADASATPGTQYSYRLCAYDNLNNPSTGAAVIIQTCSNPPVYNPRTGSYYSSLQAAYNAAASGDTLRAGAVVLTESPTLGNSIDVTIQGGYDCGFSSVIGKTWIRGVLTITGGQSTIGGVLTTQ
ncbi:MAG: hypothetical protein M0022_00310 [Desulfobacteraceae bacterium]|nr:hypothetical protein [Desulfobacteraceae bacterium]